MGLIHLKRRILNLRGVPLSTFYTALTIVAGFYSSWCQAVTGVVEMGLFGGSAGRDSTRASLPIESFYDRV